MFGTVSLPILKMVWSMLSKLFSCSDLTDFRAAELATSLPVKDSSNASFATEADSQMQDVDAPLPPTSIFSSTASHEEARLEAQELPKYLLAKSLFDCREFDRCASVFLDQEALRNASTTSPNARKSTPARPVKGKAKEGDIRAPHGLTDASNILPPLSQRSLFLALYAKYMSGEKRRMEDSEMVLGPQDGGSTVNKENVGLARLLGGWFTDRSAKGTDGSNQGWLEYLYGMILAKSKIEEEAKKWLVKSVHLAPFNWGAWLELGDLVESMEDLRELVKVLPENIMTFIFNIYQNQRLFQHQENLHRSVEDLQIVFPGSLFLKTQRALLFYHAKDYEEAEAIFSNLIEISPHRLESLDDYSNLLFVMGNRPKLAFLAQLATATDKFRPETCCVVGNYYSSKSEHEKAVVYFRRALTLDRNFTSAWTLMGHEYVEMKNTHSAIESYRRAVDVNRKDFRAWAGLGQTYELLEMHFYALFYWQRAASLRPSHTKFWESMGACYDKIDQPVQSIKAYKRALAAGPYDDAGASSFGSGADGYASSGVLNPDILYQIALMYEKLDSIAEAASYMELTVAQEEGPDNEDDDGSLDEESRPGGTGVTPTTTKARMWLARWEFSRGALSKAMELANELCQDGAEVEEAKALIRDVRARMESSSFRAGS